MVTRKMLLRMSRCVLLLWIAFNSFRGVRSLLCHEQLNTQDHHALQELVENMTVASSECVTGERRCSIGLKNRVVRNGCHNWKPYCCINRKLPDPVDSNVCGLRYQHHRERRIVGGIPTSSVRWPWVVSLERRDWDEWIHTCGGVLLNKHMVLTAAHCVFASHREDIRVRMGDDKVINIRRVIVHPQFSFTSKQNDIAVLVLEREPKYKYRKDIRPVCLPSRTSVPKLDRRMKCYIVGRGHSKHNKKAKQKQSTRLQYAEVRIYKDEVCSQAYDGPLNIFIGKIRYNSVQNICAGNKGVDSCQGDSGGPLVCLTKNENWTVHGIVSWGESCGKDDKPGVYVNVKYYQSWIEEIYEDVKRKDERHQRLLDSLKDEELSDREKFDNFANQWVAEAEQVYAGGWIVPFFKR